MMGEAKHETRAVFTAALALSTPAQRARYLDEACPGKPELRQRVEALLRAHEQASHFLEVNGPEPDALREGPGTVIGRYKLLEEIGEGAFGRVFMAEQTEPVQRKVALKIIKAGMDTREVIARFEAERQALALMDHPNIAKVLDAGATDTGRPYFVMELVRGLPITAYCEQQQLSTAGRLQLFIKVCHAVQHAHQKGIIHRDLKPTNILVTLIDGEAVPKVIDFGIAKALGQKLTEKTLFTAFQQMVGTPAYMSPEQAALSGVDVDTRSDIYSLGVLLYELLTGVTPFDQETLRKAALDEIRRMIRETEPPKPSTRLTELARNQKSEVRSQKWKEVHGDLDWIAMKCLEKDRARRYETANALALDIEHHLNQEPVAAVAPTALYRTRKFVRRHKAGLATAAALVLLLVAGVVVSAWQAVRATRAERSQSQLRQRAEAEKERADAKSQEAEVHARQANKEKETARFNLYVAQINLAQQELENERLGLALNLLEDLRPREGEQELRGFEWYYLWRQCNRGVLATRQGHEENVEALAFSPDGTSLVSADRDGTVRSWNFSSGRGAESLGRLRTEVPFDFIRDCVAFSRDGKMVAVGHTNGSIILWDASRRRARTNIRAHSGRVRSMALSPDGRWLASGGKADRWVRVWDADTGEPAGPAWEQREWATALAFSPDSKLLAAAEYGTIKVYDLAARQLRQTLAGHRFWIKCLAFLPDGKTLVSGGNNETVKFWDLATAQEKTALERPGSPDKLVVSPDGTRLALGDADGTVEVWDVATKQTRTYGHRGQIRALAFSPDGTRLASSGLDQTIKVWDLRTPADLPPAKHVEKRVWSTAFSPDGKLLAWVTDGELTRVVEVPTGKAVATLHCCNPGVSFSPDGQTLATGAGFDVALWDVATWQRRATLTGHTGGVFAVQFSPDGKTLASGSQDGMVCLWDVNSGRRRATLDGHPSKWVWSVAFSPDGTCLASAGGDDAACLSGEAVLWDAASGRKRTLLPNGALCVAFSPDGKTMASGIIGATLALWDPITGRRTADLSGPVKLFRLMTFSPDGKTLISCNDEGSVTFWDTVRGQQRATLRKTQRYFCSLAFSPDGRTLAAGALNSEVELWHAADEREAAGESPGFEYLIELAGEASWQAGLLQRQGHDAEAQEAYFNAVALYESAAAQFPGRNEHKRDLGFTCRQLIKLWASSKTAAQDPARTLALADHLIALARSDTNAAPDEAALWQDKGQLLDAVGRPEEALAALTKAIELASANTNGQDLTPKEARLSRGDLLRRMNRLAEAAADCCAALGIPRRDSLTPTNLIDLSLFYNAGLHENWQGGTGNSLAALPQGVQMLAQVQFDVRGLIQLNGGGLQDLLGNRYPASVTGIPIHRKFARLHVLHGTGWWMDAGSKIGAYILHYADGQEVELPILYVEDVLDWWRWQPTDGKEAPQATLAWTGSNPAVTGRSGSLRLFKRTWDNPHPEVEVETVEFTTTGTRCAPFLVALTIE